MNLKSPGFKVRGRLKKMREKGGRVVLGTELSGSKRFPAWAHYLSHFMSWA